MTEKVKLVKFVKENCIIIDNIIQFPKLFMHNKAGKLRFWQIFVFASAAPSNDKKMWLSETNKVEILTFDDLFLRVCTTDVKGVYFTQSGQEGGKVTVSSPTIITAGKNPKKENQTTPLLQAIMDTWNKYKSKIRNGMVRDIKSVINEKTLTFDEILTMRPAAEKPWRLQVMEYHSVSKDDKNWSKVKYPCYVQEKLDGTHFTAVGINLEAAKKTPNVTNERKTRNLSSESPNVSNERKNRNTPNTSPNASNERKNRNTPNTSPNVTNERKNRNTPNNSPNVTNERKNRNKTDKKSPNVTNEGNVNNHSEDIPAPFVDLYPRGRVKSTQHAHVAEALYFLIEEEWRGWYICGELWKPDMSRQKIASNANQELKAPEVKLEFHIFDCFNPDEKNMAFFDRWEICKKVAQTAKSKYIKLVDCELANSREEVEAFFKKKHEEDAEGILIKNLAGLYEFGISKAHRSFQALKYKERRDAEFKIIGFKEGKGKMAGQIIFIAVTEDGHEFSVDPKWNESKRREWFQKMSESFTYEGKFATIEYDILSDDGIPIQPKLIEFIE